MNNGTTPGTLMKVAVVIGLGDMRRVTGSQLEVLHSNEMNLDGVCQTKM